MFSRSHRQVSLFLVAGLAMGMSLGAGMEMEMGLKKNHH